MIQPTGQTVPSLYTGKSSAKNGPSDSSPAGHNTRGTDWVEISEGYYIQKKYKNSTLFIPATDEQLASGGYYVKDENGTTYFQVAKEEYQKKGIQGMLASLVPGEVNARMSEEVLTAIQFLPGEKREIASLVEHAAGKAGLSSYEIKKLKIEINSQGKIVVGGLKDRATLKKVQDALNEVDGLAKRIEHYQFLEKNMYNKVKALNITPYRLADDGNPAINGMDYLEWMIGQADGDIDSVEGLNDPLAYAMLEYFRDPIETADFSHKDKGVANPQGDMEKSTLAIKNRIVDKFMDYNRRLNSNADDPNRINWNNAKIRITESGAVEIEGSFAKTASANAKAESIVREILQEYLQPSEDGTESMFTTALQRITTMHDEAYGESDVEKEAVFEFFLSDISATNAYVIDKNGDAAEQVDKAIRNDVAAFVNASVEDGKIDATDLSVDKEGKITLAGAGKTQASSLIDQLNSAIQIARHGGYLAGESALNQLAFGILTRLKSLDAYGPNSDRKFLDYKSEAQEQQEHAVKYNQWSKTQPYTYSTYKPDPNDIARYAKQRP